MCVVFMFVYLLHVTDIVHRISNQPCAGQTGSVRREDMLLFDLLPTPTLPCRLQTMPHVAQTFVDNLSIILEQRMRECVRINLCCQ